MLETHHCVHLLGHRKHPRLLQVETPLHAHDAGPEWSWVPLRQAMHVLPARAAPPRRPPASPKTALEAPIPSPGCVQGVVIRRRRQSAPKSQLTRLPRRGGGGGGGDTGGHNYDLHTLVRLAPHALGYLRGHNGEDSRRQRLERDTFSKCSGPCWIRLSM